MASAMENWWPRSNRLRHCRDSLRAYFAGLKLELLDKRLGNLDEEWNRADTQVRRHDAAREEQGRQVDELKQAISDNGGDRLERLASEIRKQEILRDARQAKAKRYGELATVLGEPAHAMKPPSPRSARSLRVGAKTCASARPTCRMPRPSTASACARASRSTSS